MKEKLNIYAETLLKSCLKIEKNQPLFINFDAERLDFVRIVANKAYKLGVNDIYFDMYDPILKHDAIKNLDEEELKQLNIIDRTSWDVYAKKNAAFLMLVSDVPGLNKDLNSKKLNNIAMYINKSRKTFNDKRDINDLVWCIAAVPTEKWAKEVFPTSKDPVKKLWNAIFKICEVNSSCVNNWNKKISLLKERAEKLNKYNFKELRYTNKSGTDLTIELPENHVWCSGSERLKNGKDVIVNFPTEEVFTSPKYDKVNGIVYSSKPLIYQNNLIDEFSITFKDGKVVKTSAKKGHKALKGLVESCKNSNYLGEVALVPYDSAISNMNLIFYETLFDENASCHLALGDSFSECIKNGTNKTKDELYKLGLNKCDNHVDFMVGTKDLNIVGITQDGKEIQIFKNGNFTNLF